MASEKEREAKAGQDVVDDDAPPTYQATDPGPSLTQPTPPLGGDKSGKRDSARPTAESPFSFPIDAPLPPYSAASGSNSQRPIAIPQVTPESASPLLAAYAPLLLSYGIPAETWHSFLDTVSAFLAAKVSDRALRHAANMGKQVGEGPKSLVKGIVSHAKDVGKGIGAHAKRGNILGAAMGVIGGAISIPVSAAVGTVHTAVQLPGSAIMAATKSPESARERATAYLAVVNKDWFHSRGLHATLLDSQEISQLVGTSIIDQVELRNDKEESVELKLGALADHIARLEVRTPATLSVGPKTLWLVLTQVKQEEL
ncbi:hypothetical protein EDB81DRAFT_197152 [Dactylonectria macrodidyma]|uniref:Subunit of the RNA polymerase II mediator complex n=1 Tax=Dactylonectria macrodidyma TaxID=307937 RepID=A0A9P9FPW0_9HYPO|nr:hypothetical protein EDB81DRAFT_197152 [Dactylonectria macrodidyma]